MVFSRSLHPAASSVVVGDVLLFYAMYIKFKIIEEFLS